VKPEWTARAFRDLRGIEAYIAAEYSPEAAWAVLTRILETVDLLETNSYLGRQAERRGRRELVVGQYVIVYSIHRSGVKVVAVTHGAQRK
jgi:plasmid stabilization system protein ParE